MSFHSVDVRIIHQCLAPIWVELTAVVFFSFGFILLGNEKLRYNLGFNSKNGNRKFFENRAARKTPSGSSLLKVDPCAGRPRAGRPAALLAAWRRGRVAPTPELLRLATIALVEEKSDSLVREVVERMRQHRVELCTTRAATLALDVLARAGFADHLEEMWKAFQTELKIPSSPQIYEVLLGGFASVGDSAKVAELVAQQRDDGFRCAPRSYSLIVKGFLKNGMVDEVFSYSLAMKEGGHQVPSFAVTQLLRIAFDTDRVEEFFDPVWDNFCVSQEAISFMAAQCCHRSALDLGKKLEDRALEASTPIGPSACEALVKLYAGFGELRALDLWEDWQAAVSGPPQEGICVPLLTRCAEAKFLRLAEAIVKTLRDHNAMTMTLFSAFMKVFAYCGMYDQACDLYQDIVDAGFEPDSTMYGCLMKFAAECGRTELSRKLSERAPTLDIQNYMSLLRAAGRDKDIDRAFSVFQRLQRSGVELDTAAYNSMLDVCVSTGHMDRAYALVEEMKGLGELDIITYNTILKGHCAVRNLKAARALLEDMERNGIYPNDVSYNCLINAAVQAGKLPEAWEVIDRMERRGLGPDHFTVSIMLKSVKRPGGQSAAYVSRALELLDRAGLDPCSDDILLNTVLETCVRQRERERLETVIEQYRRSKLKPSVPTYGCLIKACSTLRWIGACWEFWREMVEERGMSPNDIVFGCMLDALVSNGYLDDALALFREWQHSLPPNTITYSTIIKGFASSHQAPRAMALWREIRGGDVKMNTVLYNALIDSQARVGAIREVTELVESMPADGCEPDIITYSTIVKAYCVRGDLDQAFAIFRNMQRDNMATDSIIYNTMLDGCTRHNRSDLADVVLADMENYNIRPSNFTLGILVKMYGRQRQLNRAFEVVATMPKKHRFVANAQVLTCLMGTCINYGDVDRAAEVFEDLKRTAEADAKAYASMINGCISHGAFEKAVAIVHEACDMDDRKISRSSGNAQNGRGGGRGGRDGASLLGKEVVDRLLRVLAQHRLDQLARPLMKRLDACGIPVSASFDVESPCSTAAPSSNRKGGRSAAGGTGGKGGGLAGRAPSGTGGGGNGGGRCRGNIDGGRRWQPQQR